VFYFSAFSKIFVIRKKHSCFRLNPDTAAGMFLEGLMDAEGDFGLM